SAVLFNEGWLATELRRLAVDVAVVDERRHTAAQIVAFVARFLRARRVELVHTHRAKDNVLGSAAARIAGVPHVIRTVHGLTEPLQGWARIKYLAYDAIDKAALWACAHRFVAGSRRARGVLEESCCRRAASSSRPYR